jgi:hypothetical protein
MSTKRKGYVSHDAYDDYDVWDDERCGPDGADPWEHDDADKFAPESKHDNDLRWFFRFGPTGLTKNQRASERIRNRYARVKRCLDDRCPWLRAYYVNSEGFANPVLAAALVPDDSGFEWKSTMVQEWPLADLRRLDSYRSGYASSPDDATYDNAVLYGLRQLRIDYLRYADNTMKSYRAPRARRILMKEAALRRAIAHSPFCRGETRIKTSDRTGRLYQEEVEGEEPEHLFRVLQRQGRIVRSTWGDWRVTDDAAAYILSSVSTDAELLFRRLIERSKEPAPPRPVDGDPWESPDDTEDRRQIKQAFELVSMPTLGNPEPGPVPHDLLGDLTRDPRKLARKVGKPTTSVDELGKRYGINSSILRRLLVDHGCDAAKIRNTPIPIDWLKSSAGERFKRAVGRLAGTNSPAAKRRQRRRNNSLSWLIEHKGIQ